MTNSKKQQEINNFRIFFWCVGIISYIINISAWSVTYNYISLCSAIITVLILISEECWRWIK